ncbi:MAG TPA: AMP-binding protein, partial [Myxococcaceae bacterium]|nr:AMP-binding protein [Myxococcaceae bacterium]
MEALESRTLPEMLWERARRGGGEVAFRVKDASGAFAPRTWDWVAGEVRRLSRALAAAGVQPQDRVGLLAPSTIEWILAEWAIVAAGAVSVPLFAVLSPGETAGYLSDVGARWVLVDAPERAETLSAIYREKGATPPRWMTLEALFSAKDAGGGQVPPAGDPDLPATIACTSGTTGRPKGVLLTHANYLALLRALPSAGILDDSLRESGILLFLPFPHSFARLILLASCMFGVPVALSDPRTLRDDAKLLQPGLIPSVPLVFQRLREGTLSALRAAPLPRRLMGSAALAVGGMAARQRQRKGTVSAWLAPFHRAADRMVLGKIRAALGLSRAHALLSG